MNEDIKKDIRRFASIEAILNTEGGKILKEKLENDFISLMDSLIARYKTEPGGLIPIIAKIDSTLELLRFMTTAESEKDEKLEALRNEEKRIQES